MKNNCLPALDLCLEHIKKLLLDAEPPVLLPEMQEVEGLRFVHDYLVQLRVLLKDFSTGNLSDDILLRGSVAGRLKALQANLLHLTWQIQQVSGGDFRHRVDFMGEFSEAFNSMVEQLDVALTALRQKENELTRLAEALQQEISLKNQALSALRLSAADFQYQAQHDSLTGVLNRRSFYDCALLELEKARTSGQYCGLALVDIDYFKKLNDTYGHLIGDVALHHVTKLARDTLRSNDLLGRFGGDEFMFFFTFRTKDTGRSVPERFRSAVAATPVSTEKGAIPLTVSIGIVCVPPGLAEARDMEFMERVLRSADTALYRAKLRGRNKVSLLTLSKKG